MWWTFLKWHGRWETPLLSCTVPDVSITPVHIVEAGSLLVVSGNHGPHAESHPLVVVGHVGQQLASCRYTDPLTVPDHSKIVSPIPFSCRPCSVKTKIFVLAYHLAAKSNFFARITFENTRTFSHTHTHEFFGGIIISTNFFYSHIDFWMNLIEKVKLLPEYRSQ